MDQILDSASGEFPLASSVLHAVLAGSPVGICVLLPPEPRIAFANPTMARILERPIPPGTPLVDAVEMLRPRFPDGKPIPFARLPGNRALAGETVHEFELLFATGSGKDVNLVCNASPVRGPDGRIVAAADMFWDVTRTKELERSREALLAAIGHDLRAPLTVIQASAEQLRRDCPSPVPRPIERILTSTDRLDAMIRDLSSFALLDADAPQLKLAQIDLADLLRSLIERMRPVFKNRPVSLSLPAAPIDLGADPLRVEQIVTNLLTNADRYSPPGEVIKVEAVVSADGAEVEVRVSDRGPGIADQEKATVFEAFRFGRQRNGASLGLGLHIARGFARAHGGDVMVHERRGGGSVFVLKLPLAPPSRQ